MISFAIGATRDKGHLPRASSAISLLHETLNDLREESVHRQPVRVGTIWQGNNASVEVSAQEVVDTPAGVFQDCYRLDIADNKRYYEHYIGYYSVYYSVWLAKDIGLVKMAEIRKFSPYNEVYVDVIVLHSYIVK